MAMRRSSVIDVEVDTGGVSRMEAAADGLTKVLQQLQQTTNETFSGKTAVQYAKVTTGAITKLQKSLQSVKRSLADFDELQRLGTAKTATSSSVKKTGTQLLLEMLESYDGTRALTTMNLVSAAMDRINTQVQISLGRMQQMNGSLTAQVAAVAQNTAAWHGNAAAREACTAAQLRLTVSMGSWNSTCAVSSAATMALKTALAALQTQLKLVYGGFQQLRIGAESAATGWQALRLSGEQLCTGLRTSVQVLSLSLRNLFSPALLGSLQAGFGNVHKLFVSGFAQLLLAVDGSFLPGWRRSWLSVAVAFRSVIGSLPANLKTAANSMISVFNSMLSGIAGGYNQLIAGLNRQRQSMAVTGSDLTKRLPSVAVPQIPHLAKGAVLPANKPFMAVVGDQKNGTNVETPLTTIQEAVALVMEDQTAAIMAGFETSVGVQKAILEAVLGISIGDDVIGQASQRYMQKMAIMRGGHV